MRLSIYFLVKSEETDDVEKPYVPHFELCTNSAAHVGLDNHGSDTNLT